MLAAAGGMFSEGCLCKRPHGCNEVMLPSSHAGLITPFPRVFFLRGVDGHPAASPAGAARQRRATAAPAEEQQSPGIRDVLGVYFTAKKCQKSVLFGQGFAGDH